MLICTYICVIVLFLLPCSMHSSVCVCVLCACVRYAHHYGVQLHLLLCVSTAPPLTAHKPPPGSPGAAKNQVLPLMCMCLCNIVVDIL